MLQSTYINPLGAYIMRDKILSFLLSLALAIGIVAFILHWGFDALFI